MRKYGFIKTASACPRLKVADTSYNLRNIESLIDQAETYGVSVMVFPELSITSYTCGDLFGQDLLIKSAEDKVRELCEFMKSKDMLVFVGAPVPVNQYLFNCAIAIQKGSILGIVPKTFIPNYSEFYEKRWFSSSMDWSGDHVKYCGLDVPFGCDILFQDEDMEEFCVGVEICEDLWSPVPPSSYAAVSGACVVANLSASNELVNKASYRKELVKQQSARLVCAYVYSSSGVDESSTDMVFSGHQIISENGIVLNESERFRRDSYMITADVDLKKLSSERRKDLTFRDSMDCLRKSFRKVKFSQVERQYSNFDRAVTPNPFVPSDPNHRDERCSEIFNIQVAGLAKRLEHTGIKKAVLGISGGLDSTLALLVTVKTFDLLGLSRNDIITVTMPGFGTTDRTYSNALTLCRALCTDLREINIKDASLKHFKDIGHDPEILDVTYENVQARERTQILMDLANKDKGLVVGTGDLSELALGWSTYNGDHMSMYGVNCSVPKTLVRYLVKWAAENLVDAKASKVLMDILDTPVSPELLPAGKSGEISQKTEDIIGPYELHDFFLYHMIRYDAEPEKIVFLACRAFDGKYTKDEIVKWLKVFYRRFFSMQFKRSCLPDGPKVGTVSLSPRGDWRMPSDASAEIWIEQLEKV